MDVNIKNVLLYTFSIGIFTNIFFYLPSAHILNVPEYLPYVLLSMLMILYYVAFKKKFMLSNQLLFWVVSYFFINAIYMMQVGFGTQEYRYFRAIIMTLFIFVSLSLLFNLDNNRLLTARRAISIGVILGSALLLMDFLMPGSFVLDETSVPGRAVATFGNSNTAAIALVLGIILTIDIIHKNLKIYYVLFVFFGVLVTFSRSGISIFIIIISIMAYQGKISKASFLTILSGIIFILLFLMFGGLDLLASMFNLEVTDNLINRITFFVDEGNSDTGDMNERKMVLLAALEMFADRPVFGNGFASTSLWDYGVSPHNSFALLLAEFGLIGGLFIPSFLYLSTYKIFKYKNREYKGIAILFIVYFMLFSMVSHNMLTYAFNITAAIILATIGYKNQDKGVEL